MKQECSMWKLYIFSIDFHFVHSRSWPRLWHLVIYVCIYRVWCCCFFYSFILSSLIVALKIQDFEWNLLYATLCTLSLNPCIYVCVCVLLCVRYYTEFVFFLFANTAYTRYVHNIVLVHNCISLLLLCTHEKKIYDENRVVGQHFFFFLSSSYSIYFPVHLHTMIELTLALSSRWFYLKFFEYNQ